MFKSRKAFSLLELLIVVTLLGVIAAYGIPTFNSSRARIDEKEAVHNLRMIGEALEQFKNHNDGADPPALLTANAINATLDINIIEQNLTYTCNAGFAYFCQATSPDGWVIQYNTSLALDDRVRCFSGGCPSCPGVGCSYDGIF